MTGAIEMGSRENNEISDDTTALEVNSQVIAATIAGMKIEGLNNTIKITLKLKLKVIVFN